MPNRRYQKGYRNERNLVMWCKNRGSPYAVRTAGSHSEWDVIEITKTGELNLYQVKGGKVKLKTTILPKHLTVHKYLAYKVKGKWVFEEIEDEERRV